MQTLWVTVLVITTSFIGVIDARPDEELPNWAKWVEPFIEHRHRGHHGFPDTPEENAEPESRWQQYPGQQWQQPFNQWQTQRPNQFGNQYGQNQFGQTQRPGQFGGNQFGQNQRPGQFGGDQFGQNQRPGQFGGDQFGQNQRPGQFGGDQYGQNQRPNQFGQNQNQFGQNHRPTQRPTTQRPHEEQYVNRPMRPGDSCTRNNKVGICTKIYECQEVIQGIIQNNKTPPPPCYVGTNDPGRFVCCLDRAGATTPKPVTAPPTRKPQTSRPAKREAVSKRKCKEYAKLAFEVTESPALINGPSISVDRCVKSAEGLIVGGVDATLGEFPHMALLGYGDNPDTLSYDCGGSLISETYVLTAAHCLADRSPSYVLLGDLILRDDTDRAEPQLIAVQSDRGIIPHPRYQYPSHYYDVALIRLAERPQLGPRVRPACLHTGESFIQGSLIASGWGRQEFGGDPSDILMKVNLNKIDFDQCNKTYRNMGNKLIDGIKNDQQICAGVLEGGKDTCQGDSGGPLQVFRSNPHCTYDIVGVVSFGKGCALPKTPGVYARVQYFVDWIEGIVWPGLSSRSSETEPSD